MSCWPKFLKLKLTRMGEMVSWPSKKGTCVVFSQATCYSGVIIQRYGEGTRLMMNSHLRVAFMKAVLKIQSHQHF